LVVGDVPQEPAAFLARPELLGMLERVRLIGGDLQVTSRPGMTRLAVKLAHYRPSEDTLAVRASA